jgi:hypothetical protein
MITNSATPSLKFIIKTLEKKNKTKKNPGHDSQPARPPALPKIVFFLFLARP